MLSIKRTFSLESIEIRVNSCAFGIFFIGSTDRHLFEGTSKEEIIQFSREPWPFIRSKKSESFIIMTNSQLTHCDEEQAMPDINDTCTSEQCANAFAKRLNNKRKIASPVFDLDEWPIIHDQTFAFDENKCKRLKLAPQSTTPDITTTCSAQLDNCDRITGEQSKRSKDQQKPATATNPLQAKYENIHTTTVQKLTTYADRLRQEIGTLKTALASEQNTVRILR